MIPLKLELKNFLSYGDQLQTVDFTNHHLICLSGKNGHGKSALLDAMTWALWGQARKTIGTPKADEGLVRLGQTRMMVSLTFQFEQKTYRIRREFIKGAHKSYVSLDFEIFDEHEHKFRSLTDKTIKTTQAKIENLIRIDYETFINSAFLRQGQSNEFSKKSSKERKEIIGSILGLDRYALLHHKALETNKKILDARHIISQKLTILESKIIAEERLKDELETIKTHKAESHITQQKHQEEIALLHSKITFIRQQESYIATLQSNLGELQKRYNELIKTLHNARQEWRTLIRQELHKTPIEFLYQRQEELLNKERALRSIQQQFLKLQEELLATEQKKYSRVQYYHHHAHEKLRAATLEYEKLKLAHNQKTKEKSQLQQEYEKLNSTFSALTQEHFVLREQLAQQPLFEIEREETRLQFQKRKDAYQRFIDLGKKLKQEELEIARKKNITQDPSNPSCPLCQQLLTQGRKRLLTAQLQQEEDVLAYRINKLARIVKKLKDLLVVQHQDMSTHEQTTEMYRKLQHQERVLCQQKDSIVQNMHTMEQTLTTLNLEITGLGEKMGQSEIVIKEYSVKVANIETDVQEIIELSNIIQTQQKTMQSLHFDHNQLNTLHAELEHLSNEITQSSHQRPMLQIKETIKSIIFDLKNTKRAINELVIHISTHTKNLENIDDLIRRFEQARVLQASITTRHEELLRAQAHHEHELSAIQEIKSEILSLQQQREAHDQDAHDYQEIITMFSKNGIPALLIEASIPEIEEEANAILARLTDNQAQIFIESLRDLKSGKVKETLDIHIADQIGIRPYEMFSGGEAFRIDFALRIAISKLLARRAGTALQTLIIDEGFGSQDEEGLKNIMNALYTIQHDFSKIIIVSHLHEFKDNFPIHFIIEKKSTGSSITVEEKG